MLVTRKYNSQALYINKLYYLGFFQILSRLVLDDLYLADPILSRHQLLGSLNFLPIFTAKRTCIQRTPLVRGH